MERLDKILSEAGICSRRDCMRLVRRGLVTIDGKVPKTASEKVDSSSVILVDGEPILRRREMTIMMNKPAGFVTSTSDDRSRTVMELLPEALVKQGVVPAGRLDKDTEGLLVFTNNGDLLHRIISPKHEISKTYLVHHEGEITEDSIEHAKEGITLKDGTVCKSATITPIDNESCTICIREGMYHQVKRMFAALGCHVTHLKRIAIGDIELGDMQPGTIRELSEEEVNSLGCR